ncbi:hypothetical protein Q5P01_019061 [Channa striata]|uniref:Gem-associated protein 5 RBS domain-containing protein n=1 Tax=Channa striata TaxID=64152 RepID=A0AA88S6E9_CHASR|nr:hypothetical protein Q5P01_019061 [Channa striata]
MVLQHSHAQGGQLDPPEELTDASTRRSTNETPQRRGSTIAEQRPADQETLLSLSSKMSGYQKQLADLPDTIKMYPHPDVVECCLVLLHFGKSSSSSICKSLLQKAKDLLRKYATGASVLKASQQFLT